MNKCLNCGKEVKNKYCNISCQNSHQNKYKIIKKYGEIKQFKVKCSSCEKDIIIEEREKIFPQKEKYYCNIKCANKRNHSDITKQKISDSLSEYKLNNPIQKKIIISFCLNCKKEIKSNKERKFCSKSCKSIFYSRTGEHQKWSIKGGRKSVLSQNKRSKNEIYFGELCKKEFNNVKLNEQIFNGWDADVILDDYKLAILWNGIWHHRKISIKHSLKQVQNRDKMKIEEIKKSKYIPYIIDDYGRFNKNFVENEFEKLKIILNKKRGVKTPLNKLITE